MIKRILLVLLLVASAMCACASKPSIIAQKPFSFAVIPDTQFEVTGQSSYISLYSEINWIVAHQKQYNIKFVLGEGDIVNNSTRSIEWQNASKNFNLLDKARIPYLLAAGNHDVYNYVPKTNVWYKPPGKLVDQYFPIFRYKKLNRYTYSMNGSSVDSYQLLNVGTFKFLMLTIPFGPTDVELKWASSVVSKYPDRRVILTTHDYIGDAGQIRTKKSIATAGWGQPMPGANVPDQIDSKFVSKFSNINIVVSGHIVAFEKLVDRRISYFSNKSCFIAGRLAADGGHCLLTATNTETHSNGNKTYAMVFNAQNRPDGGGTYFRLLTYYPKKQKIHVRTVNGKENTFVVYPRGIQGNDFYLPIEK